MTTIRHDTGADFERALKEFGTHGELPANRHSAAEAIRRHADHRQTSVKEVYWEEYDDDRIRPVMVRFEDGTSAMVSWGWVWHYTNEVPGAEIDENGNWTTWLPENRRRDGNRSEPTVRTAECECFPGLQQPVGSNCSYCGEPVII